MVAVPKTTTTTGNDVSLSTITSSTATTTTTLSENEVVKSSVEEQAQKEMQEEVVKPEHAQKPVSIWRANASLNKGMFLSVAFGSFILVLILVTLMFHMMKHKNLRISNEHRQQLKDYIIKARESGMNEQEIEKSLLENSWDKETVVYAMRNL